DPRYNKDAQKGRQDVLLGISIALTSISALVVGLRCVTRTAVVRSFGADDWTMVAALLFAITLLFMIIVMAYVYNLGASGFLLSLDQLVNTLKLQVAITIVYYSVLTLIKISILMFYLRIGSIHTWFRISSKVIIGLIVMNHLVTVVVTLAQCVPLNKAWDFLGQIKHGHCIDINIFFNFISIFHIVTDAIIISLPIKLLINIQRPRREKIGLAFIFGLGILSTAASIVRLHYLRVFIRSKDPFFESLPIHLTSVIEVNAGILCASLPMLKALLRSPQDNTTR
ncbi:hypothetical protein EJ04DRAFT_400147, partial [Polyplosphaeria fusca]